MILLDDLRLSPDFKEKDLFLAAAAKLGVKVSAIKKAVLIRKSLDCRRKPDIVCVCRVAVGLSPENEARFSKRNGVSPYKPPEYRVSPSRSELRPVVVGSGPAGLFAAYVLALSGLEPLVIERGDPVEIRKQKVERYFSSGVLDPESNVQFGEGGAGTFSDGKLNTGIKDERIAFVLEAFHRLGASESVTYDARPHVGTDVLEKVVVNMRVELGRLGAEFSFNSKLTGFESENGRLKSVTYRKEGSDVTVACSDCVLAIGHSAHDTLEMLRESGVFMTAMPAAAGVRIEHPQAVIDLANYGKEALKRFSLPPSDYRLAYNPTGFSVHTFCMCPGGSVVAASSDPDSVVTNGMSDSSRNGPNANSALLVSTAGDFPLTDPFSTLKFMRGIERRAFAAGGSDGCAPAQLVGDFLLGRPSTGPGSVVPTYRPGVKFGSLDKVLGTPICDRLRAGIKRFAAMLDGFAVPDAVLTAPETRSSSPVRIVRDDEKNSSVRGLYPCGEGAGYAGGIVSAAIDGMKCAERIISLHRTGSE